MKFLGPFKRAVERTPLATIYRSVRDDWRWMRSRPILTPFGYRFAGWEDMQAEGFEPDEAALIQSCLGEADVFVDVGANIGWYTCLARSKGKHTIAIEPFPDNVRYLMGNLEANGWTDGVEIYPVGVSDRPGLARLHGGGTGASLVSGWSGTSHRFGRMIPLTTLDILVGGRFAGKRLMIKIDIEGAEYSALQGASNILNFVPRPTWLVEITLSENWPAGSDNPNFVNTFELMWRHGYRFRSVGPTGREISIEDVREYVTTRRRPDWVGVNYVFTGDSR
ncbi:MAG: FkbM family methyltransferase [Desulfomonile tiedjei]|nr:FkbM family methyltransferase [Desulfomonile tiedjei]